MDTCLQGDNLFSENVRRMWLDNHLSLVVGSRFYVQSYCGQGERQVSLALSVGGLDGSLPQIFPFLQNLGIPSALSDLTLALSPFTSAVRPARKRFPDHEAQRSFTRGKRIETSKLKGLCE